MSSTTRSAGSERPPIPGPDGDPGRHPIAGPPGRGGALPVTGLARVVRGAARHAARWPKLTVALWIVLVIGCSVAGAITGTNALTTANAGVGESGQADRRVAAAGLRSPATESILLRATDPARATSAARELVRGLEAVPEVGTVTSPIGGGAAAATLRRDGGRVLLVRASLPGDPEKAEENVVPVSNTVDRVRDERPGVTVQQAGSASLDKAINGVVADDLKRAELISVPITLLILVLAFGALVAASIPLLLGVTAVAATMGALGVVSQIAPSSDTTASLVVLIGLAVGVDYSLFYVRREREERRRSGHVSPEAALEIAAATVGRAILVSGLTVMVALAGLLLTGVAQFTSMALGTIVVVAIAMVGSVTVLPAVLALLGDRIDRGRVPFVGRRGRRADGSIAPVRHRGWGWIAARVTRSPRLALSVAVALLIALAVPAVGMNLDDSGVESLPQDLPAVQAQMAIERAFPGAPASAELVVSGTDLGSPDARRSLQQLGGRAAEVTGGHGPIDVTVSRDARTALVAVPMPDHGRSAAHDKVRTLRDDVAPTAARVVPGAKALVTGADAGSWDFVVAIERALPLVVGFVLGLAFLLLLAVFRSVRLAATVIGLNLLSIGASFGVLVAVFQHGWAEDLLGFTSSGSITTWIPLLTFVILFGLSMDYSILVLERIREARRHGRSPAEAAAEGVAATGGTVTSAAIVMVAVFSVFATLQLLEMKQMGVGLAAAILIDATIVRGIALPAAVTLLGEKGFGRAAVPRRSRAADGAPGEAERAVA